MAGSQRGSGWPAGLDLIQAADNIDALFPKCSPKQVSISSIISTVNIIIVMIMLTTRRQGGRGWLTYLNTTESLAPSARLKSVYLQIYGTNM